MAKFKVGDKAEFIERYCGYKIGDVVEIIDVVLGGAVVNAKGKLGIFPIYTDSLKLVEPKLTKNQRIKALEKEIAELRYFKELAQEMEDNSFHDLERIEEIEGRLEHLEQAVQQYFAAPGEPSTVNDMTQIWRRFEVKNEKILVKAEKLVQEKGLTREELQLILSTFKLRDEESTQAIAVANGEREKSIYNFESASSWLNELSIDNGIVIDGVRVKGLRSVEISSGLSNISTVKVEFLTKINGLDNLQSTFSQIERNKH